MGEGQQLWAWSLDCRPGVREPGRKPRSDTYQLIGNSCNQLPIYKAQSNNYISQDCCSEQTDWKMKLRAASAKDTLFKLYHHAETMMLRKWLTLSESQFLYL